MLPIMDSAVNVIALLDMDCWEVQVYQKQKEYHRTIGKPCVVATQTDLILSVSYEAKDLGIKRLMKVGEALSICDNLEVIKKPQRFGKPDSKLLRIASFKLRDSIRRFISQRRLQIQLAINGNDEFFMDLSQEVRGRMTSNPISSKQSDIDRDIFAHMALGRPMDHPNIDLDGWFSSNPIQSTWFRNIYLENEGGSYHNDELETYITEEVLTDPNYGVETFRTDHAELRLFYGALIIEELRSYLQTPENGGWKSSGGVSETQLLAKLACKQHKPNSTTIFTEDTLSRLADQIDVRQVPGFGHKKGDLILRHFACQNMDELSQLLYKKTKIMERLFGKEMAKELRERALGVHGINDPIPFVRKIMNNSVTCAKSRPYINSRRALRMWLFNLSSEMSERLDEERKWNWRTANQLWVMYEYTLPHWDDQDRIFRRKFNLRLRNEFTTDRIFKRAYPKLKYHIFNGQYKIIVRFAITTGKDWKDI